MSSLKPSAHSLNIDEVRLLIARSLNILGILAKDEKKGKSFTAQAVNVLTNFTLLPPALDNRFIETYIKELDGFTMVKNMPNLARQTTFGQSEVILKREVRLKDEKLFDYYFSTNGVTKSLESKEPLLSEFILSSVKLLYVNSLSIKGKETVINKLAAILNYHPEDIHHVVNKFKFIVMARQLTDQQVEEIHQINYPGLFIEEKKKKTFLEFHKTLKMEWFTYVEKGLILSDDIKANKYFLNTQWPAELDLTKSGKTLIYYPFIQDALIDARKMIIPHLKLEDVKNWEMLFQYIRNVGLIKIKSETYYPKDIIISIKDAIHRRTSIKKSPLMSFKGTALESLWRKAGEFIIDKDLYESVVTEHSNLYESKQSIMDSHNLDETSIVDVSKYQVLVNDEEDAKSTDDILDSIKF